MARAIVREATAGILGVSSLANKTVKPKLKRTNKLKAMT